jgi:hypothetical protein
MVPVHLVIPGALTAVLQKAPLTPEKVAFAWRLAVGPAVHKVTDVELLRNTLVVQAKDPDWRREVERAAGLIRHRMNNVLGAGVVRGLEVTLRPRS